MFTHSLAEIYEYFILPRNFPDCSKKNRNAAPTFRKTVLKLRNGDQIMQKVSNILLDFGFFHTCHPIALKMSQKVSKYSSDY